MANYKSFNYKELAMDFSWYKVPQCDQEYLRTMMMETVTNNSVNATGVSFNDTYPNSSNFALFMSERHRVSRYGNGRRHTHIVNCYMAMRFHLKYGLNQMNL